MGRGLRSVAAAWASGWLAAAAWGTPGLVSHVPGGGVFGEPAGVTQREPEVAREGEAVELWAKVGPSFSYDTVNIYYTIDGTAPAGSNGLAQSASTRVISNNPRGANPGAPGVFFVRNEPSPFGGNDDWWRAPLPLEGPAGATSRSYGTRVRYTVGAQQGFDAEVFAGGGSIFEYSNKLPWPGAGQGSGSPGAGYPGVSFWKEEAIFGNTFTAGMIDQNATVYDLHFPSVGGVYGVGTRNEGYVDGLDTFPAGLAPGWRGQMHLNQAMPGIRVDGVTHWLSNPSGVSYDNVSQEYVEDSNTIRTTQRLYAGGSDLLVEQHDFAPFGVAFPADASGTPQRHVYLKRLVITNPGPARDVDVYWYLDPALNGGDGHDAMFVDAARGAMVAYDNTARVVTGTGASFAPPDEYNPTTDGGYHKNKSLYLACAMKVVGSVGGGGGAPSGDSWRDTSGDQGQGWIGSRVLLPAGGSVEVDFLMAGAADNFAGATGTYSFQLAPVVDWFLAGSVAGWQSQADSAWAGWLASGTTVDTPDDRFDRVLRRGLLATALHVDGVNGGVIAGFHNGAYPYVWPRDAVYAAITLARTGHFDEARNVYRYLRDVCFRQGEAWGRLGFWKQKYSTDGFVIWGAPQIDETSAFPWGVKQYFDSTNDLGFLSSHAEAVRDAVDAMTRDSQDSRLRWEEAFNLVYSNNVWEDSYDTFVYSNASVWRGLEDARQIFDLLGRPGDAFDAFVFRDAVKGGLDARLDWDGENTDISQLGIVHPFGVYDAGDFRARRVADRINGVRRKFNNAHCCAEPLVNFAGEHAGTVNRYWGDGYWNGGPWFLSTLWYGLYYAERQDVTPGTGDIENHRDRVGLLLDRLGPAGLGAEQIAFAGGAGASLLYPGQGDFVLQTAWPNAWESMSTFVDGVMKFLDYSPDASQNTMRFEPKAPGDWASMEFRNVRMKNVGAGLDHRVDVRVERGAARFEHRFTNASGAAVDVATVVRVPTGSLGCVASVTRNGVPVSHAIDPATGRVSIAAPLATGAGSVTSLAVNLRSADVDDGTGTGTHDGGVTIDDLLYYLARFDAGDLAADVDNGLGLGIPDGGVTIDDLLFYLGAFDAGCA